MPGRTRLSLYRACLVLTALLLPLANLASQARGRLTVQNLSPYSRLAWAKVVVPFAKGECKDTPKVYLPDRPIVWRPFGATWSDGSVRQALCMFPVLMHPFGEKHFQLQTRPGPLSNKDLRATLGVPGLPEQLSLRVRFNGKTTTATPGFLRNLENNPARRVDLYRTRVGQTGLVYELITTAYTGTSYVEVDLAIFFSDPSTKDMSRRLDRVWIETKRSKLVIRHGTQLNVSHEKSGTGSLVTLLKQTTLGDGQGIRRTGVVLPGARPGNTSGKPSNWLAEQTLKAAAACPLLGATTWSGTQAFGPFGYVPKPGAWLQSARSALDASIKRHKQFLAGATGGGDPFKNFGLCLAKFAGRAGVQDDFGVVKVTPTVSTGIPTFLLEVELSVLQEACRPVHFFESDGRVVRAANHPNWIVWSGRTHWNKIQSPDRLGKPHPEPSFPTHNWSGKDHEHWSSNHLVGYYLLTGDHWARREIEHEIELYLASHTTKAGLPNSHMGAARSVGRTLMAGCWIYQCTGNKQLLQRMRDRVTKVYEPTWAGRNLPTGSVRPMQIRPKDGRHLRGKKIFWAPWQDSLAAIGLAAIGRLTGEPRAIAISEEVALSCARHAWRVLPQGPRIAYALAWDPTGTPLNVEVTDTENVDWADFGISSWAIGALEIARAAAARRGEIGTQRHAERILTLMRATRAQPKDGWFDQFGDWDAVR